MHLILDHVMATVIAGIVIMAVVVIQYRAQEASVERTVLYMSKKHTLEFADLLEQELKAVGVGMPAGQRIESITHGAGGLTTAFSFWRTDETGTPLHIAYETVPTDTLEAEGDQIVLYQVRRLVNDVEEGASPPYLRHFQIDLLDAAGVVATPNDTRLIRVVFTQAMPLGNPGDYYLRDTHWGVTLHPPNLN